MEAVFALNELERANFLRLMMQSFGSSYVCLWSSLPCSPDFLLFLDGCYREENVQPGSTGSSAARRFDEYRREPLLALNNHVPGFAFVNNRPCIVLTELELQSVASTNAQRYFYQEARIKIAVFMGCSNGEIELGWSNVPMFDIQTQMADWFQEIFCRQSPAKEVCYIAVDPYKSLSSSPPLRSLSLSTASQANSSLDLFNSTNPNASLIQEHALQEAAPPLQSTPISNPVVDQTIPSTANSLLAAAMPSLHPVPGRSSTTPPHQAIPSLQPVPRTFTPLQKAAHDFALAHDLQLPTPEGEDAAMTRAILAALTSAPTMGASYSSSSFSSSSSSSSPTHMFPHTHSASQGAATAFKRYRSPLATGATAGKAGLSRESMLRRAIAFQRALNDERRQQMQEAARPTSTQLHHMISERKRREKMNESFQALRSLLPLEQAKKDKASVLTRTRDYLTSLKTQLEDLILQNQQLESQLSVAATESTSEIRFRYVCSKENFDVRTIHVPAPTPDERFVDLQITVKEESPVLHMVIRILDFLKSVDDVHVLSMEARTLIANSSAYNRLLLRLKVKGNEWDEAAFQEATRKVVAELAK